MRIRIMTVDDYDALWALWLASPEMELNDLDDSREGVTRFLRRNPDTAWVAEEGGEVIGALMAGTDGRRGYIYHAGVRRDWRGKGVGSALARTALDALKAMGLCKVGLLAFGSNEAGIAFWQKQGFAPRDDLRYMSCVLAHPRRIEH